MQLKRRKIPMNVNFEPDLLDAIAEEAKTQQRSRSWVIETAVRHYLSLSPRPALPQEAT